MNRYIVFIRHEVDAELNGFERAPRYMFNTRKEIKHCIKTWQKLYDGHTFRCRIVDLYGSDAVVLYDGVLNNVLVAAKI